MLLRSSKPLFCASSANALSGSCNSAVFSNLRRKSVENGPKSAGVFPIKDPLRGEVHKRKPVTAKS
ncbi:hypothetical protein D1823_19170 (plasmid) [Ruegeria sp. AD91A]|nr:hypothetical protein D1823_19170 [Ruegeria sp. AD91A]